MFICRSIQEYNHVFLTELTSQSLGFVPTMGALHEGHLSLIREAKKQCNQVVVSIFVNPTQFSPSEDYDAYPRTLDQDLDKLKALDVSAVFVPSRNDLYPRRMVAGVTLDSPIANILCGRIRDNHFEGVLQIITKLFNIIRPTNAYFGLKDYQQYQIVSELAKDFNYPIDIIGVSTVRESDGLAMSSRNNYLSSKDRASASAIYTSLKSVSKMLEEGARIDQEGLKESFISELTLLFPEAKVQYFEVWDVDLLPVIHYQEGRLFIGVAVVVGDVRLIDNVIV
jgi:pantoate--beta-alanine ligase